MAEENRVGRVQVSPPVSLAELTTTYEKVRDDPKAVAALYVMAMLEFTRDAETGQALIGFLMTREHTVTVRGGDKALCRSVMYHLERLHDYPQIARSYLEGATPANGYTVGAPPYTVVVTRAQAVHPTRVRLYLACSGAQSARPVVLQQEDGGWKVREESSLYTGVIPPSTH